jgi:excisionase family DNA binding protein
MVTTLTDQPYAEARLIDARAAGELLGVPTSWVLAEARSNRLPHVRLGRYVRFRPDALLRWVQDREHGPVAQAADRELRRRSQDASSGG